MKQQTAETIANVVIGVAAVAAAVVVLRTPQLRRLAWGLAVTALTTTLPAWLNREVRTAWGESGERARVARRT